MSTSTLALLALMSLQQSSTSTITWNDLSGGVQTVLIFLAIVVGIAYIVFVGFCGAIVGDLLKGKNAVALQYVAGWLLLSVGWTCVLLPCIAYYVAAISLFIVGIIPAIIFKTIYIRLCTSESFLHNITPRKFLSAIGVPPIFIWMYWLYISLWLVGGDWEEVKVKAIATMSPHGTLSNNLELNGPEAGTADRC
ncbi:hypothetical protein CGMCC3_g16828 [Colletotrichum fructicola]|nr:uncharacterized protein CGMCC3_g16828 [Colletotrichum fructicola]KAE9567035.1 hypothetical protein CGMCC3_g16828 [Colletotrichum fructicola]